MASFYLDEDIPYEAGRLLVQQGHDAVHAYDLGHRNMPDTEHLLFASSEGRILLTFNREDFRVLHRTWTALTTWHLLLQHHAGILTSWGQIPANEWADRVNNFVGQDRSFDNQMWEWRRQQQRWQQFGW